MTSPVDLAGDSHLRQEASLLAWLSRGMRMDGWDPRMGVAFFESRPIRLIHFIKYPTCLKSDYLGLHRSHRAIGAPSDICCL